MWKVVVASALALSFIFTKVESVFYTNSKENDFPRLGRRAHPMMQSPLDDDTWQQPMVGYEISSELEYPGADAKQPMDLYKWKDYQKNSQRGRHKDLPSQEMQALERMFRRLANRRH